MSLDNPPPLLNTVTVVPCYVVQTSQKTDDAIREWLEQCIREQMDKSEGMSSDEVLRLGRITNAISMAIASRLAEMALRLPLAEPPNDEVIAELLEEAVNTVWSGYFYEDAGEGTLFQQDLKGVHEELVAELI